MGGQILQLFKQADTAKINKPGGSRLKEQEEKSAYNRPGDMIAFFAKCYRKFTFQIPHRPSEP